jgi:hypothetical protein
MYFNHDEAIAVEELAPVAKESYDGKHHEEDDDGLEELGDFVLAPEVEEIEVAVFNNILAFEFGFECSRDGAFDDNQDDVENV